MTWAKTIEHLRLPTGEFAPSSRLGVLSYLRKQQLFFRKVPLLTILTARYSPKLVLLAVYERYEEDMWQKVHVKWSISPMTRSLSKLQMERLTTLLNLLPNFFTDQWLSTVKNSGYQWK